MTQKLKTEGGSLAFDVYGTTGTPIVASPGLGDTRATWRELGPRLAEAGYVVYAMDLRGHGDSDATFASYTPEDIGDDIVALLEARDLTDAILIGNSISGAAIVHAALAAPSRVAQLVMSSPFVRDVPADRFLRPLVPLLFGGLWGTWAWGAYRKTLFITQPADQVDNQAQVVANLAEPGRMAAVRAMLRATKSGISARLKELEIPTLALIGAQDPDYTDPEAEGEALRELLGGEVQVALIDQTGHYPHVERPDEFAGVLLGYLEAKRGA